MVSPVDCHNLHPHDVPGISQYVWHRMVLEPDWHKPQSGQDCLRLDGAVPCSGLLPLPNVALLYVISAPAGQLQVYCCSDRDTAVRMPLHLRTQEACRMFEGMVLVHDVTWHAMHGMGQWWNVCHDMTQQLHGKRSTGSLCPWSHLYLLYAGFSCSADAAYVMNLCLHLCNLQHRCCWICLKPGRVLQQQWQSVSFLVVLMPVQLKEHRFVERMLALQAAMTRAARGRLDGPRNVPLASAMFCQCLAAPSLSWQAR